MLQILMHTLSHYKAYHKEDQIFTFQIYKMMLHLTPYLFNQTVPGMFKVSHNDALISNTFSTCWKCLA